MAFVNRIRLPFQTKKPQFPSERNIFRKADGSTKVISAIVRHTYELKTDYLPEHWHKRLAIALHHDNVNIENENYLGGISIDSEYEINWQDFLDYPVAQAITTIQVTPFSATNSNCQTCEELSQIVAVDDTFLDPLTEGQEAIFPNVMANDSVCCYPSVASLVTYNTDYLSSASITPEGELTIQLKPETGSGTNVKVATYRVTCPDGTYDDADVFADITGTAPACGEPTNIQFGVITTSTAPVSWDAAIPAPGVGYIWNLFLASNPVTPVQSGTTAGLSVNLTGLTPNTEYIFQVYSDCGEGSFSSPISENFTTDLPPIGLTCGRYRVYTEGGGPPPFISYLDCEANSQNQVTTRYVEYEFCMYQVDDDSGPLYFNSTDPGTSLVYLGLCS